MPLPSLIAGTQTLNPDEPAFGLSEVNLQSGLPGVGWRRYQVIYVVRADRLAECRIDLGPADAFTAPQFRVPGGVKDETTGRITIVHNVGELTEIAEYLRERPALYGWDKPPLDIGRSWWEAMEKAKLRRKAVSAFGPDYRVQRDN